MGGGAPAYKVSKTSLNALTRTSAAELKRDGILVNSVCPGWVATDMGGSGGRPIPDGATGIVWAATLPDEGPTGGFFLSTVGLLGGEPYPRWRAISGRAVDGQSNGMMPSVTAAQRRPACQYASNRSRNALGFSAYRAAPRPKGCILQPGAPLVDQRDQHPALTLVSAGLGMLHDGLGKHSQVVIGTQFFAKLIEFVRQRADEGRLNRGERFHLIAEVLDPLPPLVQILHAACGDGGGRTHDVRGRTRAGHRRRSRRNRR